MLTLPKFEPTPELTKNLRLAAEGWLVAAPWDANQLSNLAYLLVTDCLNRWNEAENNPQGGRELLDEAEQRVARAFAIDSDLGAAHYANGFVLRAREKFCDAKKEFAGLTIRYPNWAAAYAQEGNDWINLGPKNLNVAIRLVQQALNMVSDNGIFYWILGRAYFFNGDFSEAIPALEKSRSLRDNVWFNRLYLVSAYTKVSTANGRIRLADAHNELNNFKSKFGYFTRDTLDSYENDIPNHNLNFDEFHQGLDDAGFKHGFA
jgi:tetratricopeptide (TPR) repeat protein